MTLRLSHSPIHAILLPILVPFHSLQSVVKRESVPSALPSQLFPVCQTQSASQSQTRGAIHPL